jgi:hypothetical protein
MERPIASALKALLDHIRLPYLYLRLRLAADDMASVNTAALELARYRHRPGSPGPVGHNPYGRVEDVLEAGLVVVYARSFTGNASLGRKWQPEIPEDRDLHERLLVARDVLHAHADHTAYRSVVDPQEVLGNVKVSPMVAHERMPGDILRAIAALCERQQLRFEAEAARVYAAFRPPASD